MSTYDNVYDMTVYVIYIHRCKDECMEFIVLVVIVYVDIMVNIILSTAYVYLHVPVLFSD